MKRSNPAGHAKNEAPDSTPTHAEPSPDNTKPDGHTRTLDAEGAPDEPDEEDSDEDEEPDEPDEEDSDEDPEEPEDEDAPAENKSEPDDPDKETKEKDESRLEGDDPDWRGEAATGVFTPPPNAETLSKGRASGATTDAASSTATKDDHEIILAKKRADKRHAISFVLVQDLQAPIPRVQHSVYLPCNDVQRVANDNDQDPDPKRQTTPTRETALARAGRSPLSLARACALGGGGLLLASESRSSPRR